MVAMRAGIGKVASTLLALAPWPNAHAEFVTGLDQHNFTEFIESNPRVNVLFTAGGVYSVYCDYCDYARSFFHWAAFLKNKPSSNTNDAPTLFAQVECESVGLTWCREVAELDTLPAVREYRGKSDTYLQHEGLDIVKCVMSLMIRTFYVLITDTQIRSERDFQCNQDSP